MVTIIDYGAGNLGSVRLSLEYLGFKARVASERSAVLDAERIVFPGVGAIAAAMKNLIKMGLAETLREVVARGVPFLGICLGAQAVFERSDENGGTQGLGIMPGSVKAFNRDKCGAERFKIPHMGWNNIRLKRDHPVLRGITDGSSFYFVHGYYPVPLDEKHVLAETEYSGTRFASVVGRDNIVATQFHPERSGRLGLKLLDNFCRWDGASGGLC